MTPEIFSRLHQDELKPVCETQNLVFVNSVSWKTFHLATAAGWSCKNSLFFWLSRHRKNKKAPGGGRRRRRRLIESRRDELDIKQKIRKKNVSAENLLVDQKQTIHLQWKSTLMMSRWHYDHYVQFGQRAGGQTRVWGRGGGWGTWGSSWTERVPPGCWSLREVSPVHRVSGGSARFSSQAWGNVVGFLFFERPEGKATCQRAAARTQVFDPLWCLAADSLQSLMTYSLLLTIGCCVRLSGGVDVREITSEGFRRRFHLARRVTTWCRVDTGPFFSSPAVP